MADDTHCEFATHTQRLRVFEARNGSPLSTGNIRNRVLQPLLAKLGIPKAGPHAFRHSRVTMLGCARTERRPISRSNGSVTRA